MVLLLRLCQRFQLLLYSILREFQESQSQQCEIPISSRFSLNIIYPTSSLRSRHFSASNFPGPREPSLIEALHHPLRLWTPPSNLSPPMNIRPAHNHHTYSNPNLTRQRQDCTFQLRTSVFPTNPSTSFQRLFRLPQYFLHKHAIHRVAHFSTEHQDLQPSPRPITPCNGLLQCPVFFSRRHSVAT